MIQSILNSLREHRYKHRHISLHGAITEQKALPWVAQLLSFAHESSKWPIVLYVDSPGGRMIESITVLRTIDDISCPIATHCHGLAGGTAAAIVAHGQRGFRTAVANAHFSFSPTFSDPVKGYVEAELSQFDTILIESIAEDTGKHESEIASLFRSHAELSASEAVAFGFIDSVSPVPNTPPAAR